MVRGAIITLYSQEVEGKTSKDKYLPLLSLCKWLGKINPNANEFEEHGVKWVAKKAMIKIEFNPNNDRRYKFSSPVFGFVKILT